MPASHDRAATSDASSRWPLAVTVVLLLGAVFVAAFVFADGATSTPQLEAGADGVVTPFENTPWYGVGAAPVLLLGVGLYAVFVGVVAVTQPEVLDGEHD